jgi:RimJ/RimL family protein N-acetyltransferase
MRIIPINEQYREEVNYRLKEEWSCPPVISRGRAIDTTELPGFVAIEEERIAGIVTYHMEEGACEIVTFNSFLMNRGVGTLMVKVMLQTAKEAGCQRLWLITTNDNTNAIRFYQRKGFELIAVHINAILESRRMKPEIPMIGEDGIPIKHELEFEIQLEKKY